MIIRFKMAVNLFVMKCDSQIFQNEILILQIDNKLSFTVK